MPLAKSFAGDNHSGVHPTIMRALEKANTGHVAAYGDDPHTRAAEARFRDIFGDRAGVFFVFLGTAANVLALKALVRPHQAVICARSAHINVDECGAPEGVVGCKLLTAPGRDGKLAVSDVEPFLADINFVHHNRPKAISITQATEFGTLYSVEEIREMADFAHANGLHLHMDGARLANAAAAMNVSPAAMTVDAGVDVLSFGGTKNGLMYGEAVVFFRPELAEEFDYIRKQGMQLASKMRFISAQFEALLADDLWLENANAANASARRLAAAVGDLPGVSVTRPVETNAVFATVPPEVVAPLRRRYFFYVWDRARTEIRLMTSFDTTEEDIASFADAFRDALESI